MLGIAASAWATRAWWAEIRANQVPALLLVCGCVLPLLLLGAAFASVEAPISTHDGAFHVETIDGLRSGAAAPGWYPIGFHASVAAVLGVVPWLDSARGTLEAALGLALLGPAAACALGMALGLEPLVAAAGAVVLALTWTYPYDYHLWAGWPQAMGVLLLLGLFAVALRWIERPTVGWATLGGLFAGAIVVTHGTEVYSAAIGVLVIAAARLGRINPRRLMMCLPLALGVALLAAAPYLSTLVGWAGSGGATAAGALHADFVGGGNPAPETREGWFEVALGSFGAASVLDLPVRLALFACGARLRQLRLVLVLWALFAVLALLFDLLDLPVIRSIFVVTYPWLSDHRPRQVAVVFASLIGAGGLRFALAQLGTLRPRLAAHPHARRRLIVACGLLLVFFAEGSAVSVFKRVALTVGQQDVVSADDAAAFTWLRQHARPGTVVVNDHAADAGIWVPFKAELPVLLPRSEPADVAQEREPILQNLLDLDAAPAVRARACALGVEYVYVGARPLPFDEHVLPERGALERAPNLEEVFASGDAAVFRLHLPCGSSA